MPCRAVRATNQLRNKVIDCATDYSCTAAQRGVVPAARYRGAVSAARYRGAMPGSPGAVSAARYRGAATLVWSGGGGGRRPP